MVSSQSTPSARRHDLDALRAFAMILGVLLHASLPYATDGWMVSDARRDERLLIFVSWVHGFRMPLFIFVSGYFTAMLWRGRGLAALLRQRFLRVFLPLILGVLTVLPLQDVVVGWARQRAAAQDAARFAMPGVRSEVVEAIRSGDLTTLHRLLDSGADPNQTDPEFHDPALNWASHYGSAEAVRLLLDHGADVDRPSRGGHRALHSAAFFAHPEVMGLLIERGADVLVRDLEGGTPLKASQGTWPEVTTIAGFLRLPVRGTQEEFQERRARCRELLRRAGAEGPGSGDASSDAPGLLARSRQAYREFLASDRFLVQGRGRLVGGDPSGRWHLVLTSTFDHLWFLGFLCWLVAGFGIAVTVGSRLGIPAPSGAWLLTWKWPLVLVPATLVPQLWMGDFGPDTSVGFLPQPHVLLYYGIFFAAGTLYFESRDADGRLGRHPWVLVGVASLLLFPAGLAMMKSLPLGSGLAQVLFAWLMCFGCLGLFRRYLDRENPSIRYLADSAYWLYIAHHPVVALFQGWMRSWDLDPLLKWALLTVFLLGVLLGSYHLLVRNTWLGVLLNGRRAGSGDRIGPAS